MSTKKDVRRLLFQEFIQALVCWLLGFGALIYYEVAWVIGRKNSSTIEPFIAAGGLVLFALGTLSLALRFLTLARYRRAAARACQDVCPSCGAVRGEKED